VAPRSALPLPRMTRSTAASLNPTSRAPPVRNADVRSAPSRKTLYHRVSESSMAPPCGASKPPARRPLAGLELRDLKILPPASSQVRTSPSQATTSFQACRTSSTAACASPGAADASTSSATRQTRKRPNRPATREPWHVFRWYNQSTRSGTTPLLPSTHLSLCAALGQAKSPRAASARLSDIKALATVQKLVRPAPTPYEFLNRSVAETGARTPAKAAPEVPAPLRDRAPERADRLTLVN